MNWTGPLLGLITLALIGLGFAWVIQLEYRLGWEWWPYVLAAGVALLIGSLFAPGFWASALMGIAGASLVWGSTELPKQAERARRGWFPANPRPKPRPPLADRIERWPRPRL
ncbi:MAG: DUF4491 family protein [Anaerolineae bacterium]